MARPALTPDELDSFRDQLCDTALRLFSTYGHHQVTMRAIARELGCSHTTPYRYFESKEAIFVAVRARCFEQFNAWQRARLALAQTLDQRLWALAEGYLSFAQAHPQAFSVMFDLSHVDLGANAALRDALRESWELLRQTLRGAAQEGALAQPDAQVVYLFWSAFHGIASLAKLHHESGLGWEPGALLAPMLTALTRAHDPQARHTPDPPA